MRLNWGITFWMCIGASAVAQPRTMSEKNEGGIVFKAVSELNQETTTPKLGNAEPADPSHWLASFYSWSGNFECTSTLIGPQTLLTAAHCVGSGKEASIALNGETYTGPCTHHSDYPNDASADYALCFLSRAVVGAPYESVNTDANDIKTGRRLRLSGYGCTTLVGTGPRDGIYRVGEAPITALPGELDGEPNTIVTAASTFEDSLLCRGDSGGAAFIESEMSSARKVVSVNSRVWVEERRSYLASLTSSTAKPWLLAWSKMSVHHRVCGLPMEPPGCR